MGKNSPAGGFPQDQKVNKNFVLFTGCFPDGQPDWGNPADGIEMGGRPEHTGTGETGGTVQTVWNVHRPAGRDRDGRGAQRSMGGVWAVFSGEALRFLL